MKDFLLLVYDLSDEKSQVHQMSRISFLLKIWMFMHIYVVPMNTSEVDWS